MTGKFRIPNDRFVLLARQQVWMIVAQAKERFIGLDVQITDEGSHLSLIGKIDKVALHDVHGILLHIDTSTMWYAYDAIKFLEPTGEAA